MFVGHPEVRVRIHWLAEGGVLNERATVTVSRGSEVRNAEPGRAQAQLNRAEVRRDNRIWLVRLAKLMRWTFEYQGTRSKEGYTGKVV